MACQTGRGCVHSTSRSALDCQVAVYALQDAGRLATLLRLASEAQSRSGSVGTPNRQRTKIKPHQGNSSQFKVKILP